MTIPTDNQAALDAPLQLALSVLDDAANREQDHLLNHGMKAALVVIKAALTQEPIDLGGMYRDDPNYEPQASINEGFNEALDTLKQKYPERFS